MRKPIVALVLFAAFALSGCIPVITAAGNSTPGQAAIQRAVDSAFARAGLAPTPPAGMPGQNGMEVQISAGPMLADVTHRGAAIWVQTDGPATVQVIYAEPPVSENGTSEPRDAAISKARSCV